MREARPPRTDPPRRVHRLGDGKVRRVRLLAERVEHEQLEPVSSGHDSSGIALQSVRYAKPPKVKPEDGARAVENRNRQHFLARPRRTAP